MMDILHKLNIVVHVLTGTLALILGLFALLSTKGGKTHSRSGRFFLGVICFVIATGLLGVFVFGRNTFLLVITVLSGYVAFSGYRAIKFKSNSPKRLDIIIALFSLSVLVYFLYYFESIGMIWSPVIIYSTIGALVLVISYDFLRYLIPRTTYKRYHIWIYEHIYKMTSAFAALLSAFSGTVFEQYQPHSQYLPSVLGILIILGFMFKVNQINFMKFEKN